MSFHFTIVPEAVGFADIASKTEVIEQLAALFSRVYRLDEAMLKSRLSEREALGSTGFGRGVAIPHARIAGLRRPVAAFLRLARPIDFDSADGAPVSLVFGLISPQQAGAQHLQALAAISRLMREDRVHEALVSARSEEELFGLLANVIDRDAA